MRTLITALMLVFAIGGVAYAAQPCCADHLPCCDDGGSPCCDD